MASETRLSLELLEAELRRQEELWEAKLNALSEVVKTTKAATDERLHYMNDVRGSLSDQTSKMMSRVEAIAQIQAVDARNIAEVNTIREKLEAFGKPNWFLIIGASTVLFALVTGVWLIIGLKMESVVSPIVARQTANVAKIESLDQRLSITSAQSEQSRTADIDSRNDRGQLNARVREIETTLTERRAVNSSVASDVASLKVAQQANAELTRTITDRLQQIRADIVANKAALIEIETQFCASDIVRNLIHANDLREISMMWRKLFADHPIPTDNAFYPQICNREIQAKSTQ